MKQKKSMRRILIPSVFTAAVLTIGLFAVISQYKLWISVRNGMERDINNGLDKSDQCLNIILEKYEALLYELCTDDEVIEIVENINRDENDLDVNTSRLRRELAHTCHSNETIEGILVDIGNNQRIFYDSLSSSSSKSLWIHRIPVPSIEKGTKYYWNDEPVVLGDEEVHMFQIARRLVDYRDIKKTIGTVVISINENELREAIDLGGGSDVCLVDGDRIVSAPDKSMIGRDKNLVFQKGKRVAAKQNEKTGWEIANVYSLKEYKRALWGQAVNYFLIAAIVVGIMVALVDRFAKPVLKSVDMVVDAMNTLETGDFSVRIPIQENMSQEVERIANGFNEMAFQLDEMLGRVKQAVVEQKNAEISALEAQIDPHFLYNTLDTINWRAIEKEEYEISEMVGALADILRYAVKNAGARTTVRQEISWLRQYILLQSARLGKALDTRYEITKEAWNCRLHKLLLQPFVENSIKHGFYRKDGECILKIFMDVEGSFLHIVLEDNGHGMEEELVRRLNDEKMEADGHLGIINVRKRLKLYYSEEAGLYFESEKGQYTRVHLLIPAEEAIQT